MTMNKISNGTVHTVPADLQKSLSATAPILLVWEDLTPLARNEWICWVESAKKLETRNHRIKRTIAQLKEGKCRPCCWAGCIHRSKTGK
jgi:uncharacterized protein YdeI (YjbR/CyaY-like superfamily)